MSYIFELGVNMLFSLLVLLSYASLNLANDMAYVDDFSTMSFQDILTRFESFRLEHNRTYKDASEAIMRLQAFTKSIKRVIEMNKEAGKPLFGINELSDYTQEELARMLPVQMSREERHGGRCRFEMGPEPAGEPLPEELDWRKRGVVTHVKYQYQCGSCWAFSTIGAVEGAHARCTNKLISLSEQQLISCDDSNGGCDGGWPGSALEYIIENGIASEYEYSYFSQNGKDTFACIYKSLNINSNVDIREAVNISGCVIHNLSHDETDLQRKLAKYGPLSISLHVGDVLTHYKGGVVENCPRGEVNHAVLLVGYGTSKDGIPYWLIKNSWSSRWGEQGYVRVKRNVNACNIVSHYAFQAEVDPYC